MAALRQATADSHARIEALLQLGGPFDRSHYDVVLQGFETFLGGWEPLVRGWLPEDAQDWFDEGRRVPLVRQDLHVLDLDPVPADAAVLPDLASEAAAWGSLYVLEGSALGAQLIAQGLQRRLGIGADNGGAYFNGCGRGTAARWRQYRERADAALAGDEQATAEAAAAAVRTFDALIDTFRELLDDRAAA